MAKQTSNPTDNLPKQSPLIQGNIYDFIEKTDSNPSLQQKGVTDMAVGGKGERKASGEFDFDFTSEQDPYKMRAENLSLIDMVGKKSLNMVTNIPLSVAEMAGYLVDFESHAAMLQGDGSKIDNGFSQLMREWKTDATDNFLGTGLDLNVYEENPGELNFTDEAFWVNSVGSIVESVAEFFLTGAGIGAIAKGAAGVGTRAALSINRFARAKKAQGALNALNTELNTAKSAVNITNAFSKTAQFGTSASTSYLTGIMNGVDVYNNAFQEVLKDTGSEEEAKKIAGKAAATTVWLTTGIGAITNYTSLAPLFRKTRSGKVIHGTGSDVAKKKLAEEGVEFSNNSYLKWLKDVKKDPELLKKGASVWERALKSELLRESGQEGIEEYGENIAAQVGDAQVKEALGKEGKVDWTSKEAMFAFGMGAIGGIFGKGMMSGIERMGGESASEYAARSFQETVERQINYLEKKAEIQEKLAKATKENDAVLAQEAKINAQVESTAIAIANDSVEELKETYQEIIDMSLEDAQENGFETDSNSINFYKKTAAEAKENVDDFVALYEAVSRRAKNGDFNVNGKIDEKLKNEYAKSLLESKLSQDLVNNLTTQVEQVYGKDQYELDLIEGFNVDNDNILVSKQARRFKNRIQAINMALAGSISNTIDGDSTIETKLTKELKRLRREEENNMKSLLKDTNYTIDSLLDSSKIYMNDDTAIQMEAEIAFAKARKSLNDKELAKYNSPSFRKRKASDRRELELSKEMEAQLEDSVIKNLDELKIENEQNKIAMQGELKELETSILKSHRRHLEKIKNTRDDILKIQNKEKRDEMISKLRALSSNPDLDIDYVELKIRKANKEQALRLKYRFEHQVKRVKEILDLGEIEGHWLDGFPALNEDEDVENPVKVITLDSGNPTVIKVTGTRVEDPIDAGEFFFVRDFDGKDTITVFDYESRMELFTYPKPLSEDNVAKRIQSFFVNDNGYDLMYENITESFRAMSPLMESVKKQASRERALVREAQLQQEEAQKETDKENSNFKSKVNFKPGENWIKFVLPFNEDNKPKKKRGYTLGRVSEKRVIDNITKIGARWVNLKQIDISKNPSLEPFSNHIFYIGNEDGKYVIYEGRSRSPISEERSSIQSAIKSAIKYMEDLGGPDEFAKHIDYFMKAYTNEVIPSAEKNEDEKFISEPFDEPSDEEVLAGEILVQEGDYYEDPKESDFSRDEATTYPEPEEEPSFLSDPAVAASEPTFYPDPTEEEMTEPLLPFDEGYPEPSSVSEEVPEVEVEAQLESTPNNDLPEISNTIPGVIESTIGDYVLQDKKVVIEDGVIELANEDDNIDFNTLHDPNLRDQTFTFELNFSDVDGSHIGNNWFRNNILGKVPESEHWKTAPIYIVAENGKRIGKLQGGLVERKDIFDALIRGDKVTGQQSNIKTTTKEISGQKRVTTKKFINHTKDGEPVFTPVFSGKNGISYQYYRNKDGSFTLREGSPIIATTKGGRDKKSLQIDTDHVPNSRAIDKRQLAVQLNSPNSIGTIFIGVTNPSGIVVPYKAMTSNLSQGAIDKVIDLIVNRDFNRVSEIVYDDSPNETFGRNTFLSIRTLNSNGKRFIRFANEAGEIFSVSEEQLIDSIKGDIEPLNLRPLMIKDGKMSSNRSLPLQKVDIAEEFKSLLSRKKYNVDKSKFMSKNYTSPVTGQTYKTYEDYLGGAPDINGATNEEADISIVHTDVFNDNGNFFYDVGVNLTDIKIEESQVGESGTNAVNEKEVVTPKVTIGHSTNAGRLKGFKSLKKLRVSKSDSSKIKLEESKKWLEDRGLPLDMATQVFEASQRMTDGMVHGYFEDGLVHLWSGAESGTEYHEAFHAVFEMYTSEKQKRQLLEEAKAMFNTQDDLQAEEELAEAFREFVMSGTVPRTTGGKLLKFIKDLYNFIKSYLTNKTTIDVFFNQIQFRKGAFKYRRRLNYTPSAVKYRRVADMSPDQITSIALDLNSMYLDLVEAYKAQGKLPNPAEIYDDMKMALLQGFFRVDGQPVTASMAIDLFNFKEKTGSEESQKKGAEYNEIVDANWYDIKDAYEIMSDSEFQEVANVSKEDEAILELKNNNLLLDIYKNWESEFDEYDNMVKTGWKTIVRRAAKDQGILIQVDEQERIFSKSSHENSAKDSLSSEVKQFLSTIRSGEKGLISANKLIPFEEVYGKLSRILSDAGSFQEMIDRIEEHSGSSTESLGLVGEALIKRGERDPGFISRFFSSMAMTYNNFVFTVEEVTPVYDEEKNETTYETRIRRSDSNSMRVTKFIFDKWRSSSRKGLYSQNSDGSFKVDEEILSKINDLAITLVDYNIKSDDIVSLEQIQELEDLLFNLGFSDFSDPFKGSTKLQYLIKNGTIVGNRLLRNGELFNYILGIGESASKQGKGIELQRVIEEVVAENNNGKIYDIFEQEASTIRRIVGVYEVMETEAYGSFTNGENKSVYPINMHNTLTRQFGAFKSFGDSEDVFWNNWVENFKRDQWYMLGGKLSQYSSPLIRSLLESEVSRDAFFWAYHDAYKQKGNKSVSTYTSDSPKTSFLTRLNAFLNNKNNKIMSIPLPTLADRGNMITVNMSRLNEYKVGKKLTYDEVLNSQNVKNALLGYVIQDIKRAKRELKFIKSDKFNPVKRYHKKISKSEWNELHSEIKKAIPFPEDANSVYIPPMFTQLSYLMENEKAMSIMGKALQDSKDRYLNDPNEIAEQLKEVLDDIKSDIKRQSRQVLDKMEKFEIQDVASEDNPNKSLVDTSQYQDIEAFALDYTLSNIIGQQELRKITAGDVGFYKDYEDFSKRNGGMTTPGIETKLSGDFNQHGDMPEYTMAIIGDIFAQEDSKDSLEGLKKAFPALAGVINSTYLSSKKNEDGEIVVSGSANKTDAMGFTTIHKHRYKMLGNDTWTQNHQEAYESYIQGGLFIANDGSFPILQPLKTYHDGLYMIDGRMQRVLVKHSTVPLLREFTKNYPDFEELRQKMEAEGAYKGEKGIDEVNMDSAIKAGAMNIFDAEGNRDEDGVIDFSSMKPYPVKLQTRFQRQPQIIPLSTKVNRFGSQLMKLIISNMDMSVKGYNLKGKDRDAKFIFDKYQEAVTDILDRNLKELYSELKYGKYLSSPTSENKSNFLKSLKEKLTRAAEERNMSDNYLDSLAITMTENGLDFDIPLSMPMFQRKFESIILGLFKSQVMTIPINGKALVQMAEFGTHVEDGSLKFIHASGEAISSDDVVASIKKLDSPININARFAKDQKKANISNKMIGFGSNGSSTYKYAQAYGSNANTGSYTPEDVVFMSVNGRGRPNHEENIRKTKSEIDKAITQGVKIIVADNKNVANSAHNSIGEGQMRDYLLNKGMIYIEKNGLGLYVNPKNLKEGEAQLKHAEIAIPYDAAIKMDIPQNEDGTFDLSVLEAEGLDIIVGYRIPTQGKNSMLPMKIKRVLPKSMGKVILVPGEITAQMGSDFDVDKLFTMQPNYNIKYVIDGKEIDMAENLMWFLKKDGITIKKADLKKILNEPATLQDIWVKNSVFGTRSIEELNFAITNARNKQNDWLKSRNYSKKIEKVDYELDKVSNNSREGMENMLIDIVESILMNPIHTEEMISPIDSDTMPNLKAVGKQAYPDKGKKVKSSDIDAEETLQFRNQDGGTGIGIAAVNTTGAAVSQYANDRKGRFYRLASSHSVRFDGKVKSDLTTQVDDTNQLITYLFSKYMTIAVDGAKDPIMSFVNDNPFTSPVTTTIVRSGISSPKMAKVVREIIEEQGGDTNGIVGGADEVASIFRMQPIIMELSEEYKNRGLTPDRIPELVMEINEKYGGDKKLKLSDLKSTNMNLETLAKNLRSAGNFSSIEEAVRNTSSQLEVLKNFYVYHKAGQQIANDNKIFNSDRISDMSSMSALEAYADVYERSLGKNMQGEPLNTVTYGLEMTAKEDYYPISKKYLSMIDKTRDFGSMFFPFSSGAFASAKADIKEMLGIEKMNKKTFDLINSQTFNWLMGLQGSPLRGAYSMANRDRLLTGDNNIAKRVEDIKSRIANLESRTDKVYVELNENPFLRRLVSHPDNFKTKKINKGKGENKEIVEVPMFEEKTLKFDYSYSMSQHDINSMIYGFEDLYTMKDKYPDSEIAKEASELAKDLVYYAIRSKGFTPGPDNFIDLIPLSVWKDKNLDLSGNPEKKSMVDFFKSVIKTSNADGLAEAIIENNSHVSGFVKSISRDQVKGDSVTVIKRPILLSDGRRVSGYLIKEDILGGSIPAYLNIFDLSTKEFILHKYEEMKDGKAMFVAYDYALLSNGETVINRTIKRGTPFKDYHYGEVQGNLDFITQRQKQDKKC